MSRFRRKDAHPNPVEGYRYTDTSQALDLLSWMNKLISANWASKRRIRSEPPHTLPTYVDGTIIIPTEPGEVIYCTIGSWITFDDGRFYVVSNEGLNTIYETNSEEGGPWAVVWDGDGLWYVIPAECRESFNAWSADNDPNKGPGYVSFRIGHPSDIEFPSYTNRQKES